MFERFTEAAREVVARARAEADLAGVRFIGTEHLLMALLDPAAAPAYDVLHAAGVRLETVRSESARAIGRPSGALGDEDAEALKTIGIDLDAVIARVEQSYGPGALSAAPPPRASGHIPFTRRAKKAIEFALREALHQEPGRVTRARLARVSIGTEHILLGLIREGDGLAATILRGYGIDLMALRAEILKGPGQAA